MKKVIFLSLLVFCLACESEGPEPEVTSEVLQLDVEDTNSSATTEQDQVFLVVEQSPEFEGGADAWNNFLKNQIEYPAQARRQGVEGRVFVSFIVQADGELTDFQIVRGIGAGCDEEALRVVKKSPYWNPGEQRGRKVATKMALAITFKL